MTDLEQHRIQERPGVTVKVLGLLLGIFVLLVAIAFYMFNLKPRIDVHRVVKRLAARGVQMTFLGGKSPVVWDQLAENILGAEVVAHPISMDFRNNKVQPSDLLDAATSIQTLELDLSGQSLSTSDLAPLSQKYMRRLHLADTHVGSGTCRPDTKQDGKPLPGFEILANCSLMDALTLSRTNVNDDDLKVISRWHSMRWLMLDETCVTDAGVDSLNSFPNLLSLSLGDTQVTSAGLKKLKTLKLEFLSLNGIELGPEGPPLLKRFPRLERLQLERTGFTDTDCDRLLNLKSLKSLLLGNTPVTDRCLSKLAQVPSLQALDLRSTQITAEGLKQLQPLSNLRTLGIGGIILAEPAAIEGLSLLPALKMVNYSPTPNLEARLAELRQRLPNIKLQGPTATR